MCCVGHVIGEEKYECEMLNVVARELKMLVGRVYCDFCCGFLFEAHEIRTNVCINSKICNIHIL